MPPFRDGVLKGGHRARRLLCERVDVGGEVLRLAARQRHVHPGMRINDRKRERVRVGSIFSRDRFKRRGVGHDPARKVVDVRDDLPLGRHL